MPVDDELERFKRLKLHEYAASLGYELDKAESSKRELIMRRNGDKVSIRLDADSHYVYYSFRDAGDNGTILDFVMTRLGKNLGEARRVLRLWSGTTPVKIFEPLDPAPRFDRSFVKDEYAKTKQLVWHDYLEQERKLPRKILTGPRFRGRIRVDAYANAIFPHEDDDGLCGYEIRGRHFKGFADMGEKGLWTSNAYPEDKILVIGEGAIDCISYETLQTGHRCASFAGGISQSKQPELIMRALRAMSPGSGVICISHDDPAGHEYAAVLEDLTRSVGHWFVVHRPNGVKDWNDALKAPDLGLRSFPAAL